MISDNFAYQYKDNKHLTVVSYVAESLQTHQHEQVISFLLVFLLEIPSKYRLYMWLLVLELVLLVWNWGLYLFVFLLLMANQQIFLSLPQNNELVIPSPLDFFVPLKLSQLRTEWHHQYINECHMFRCWHLRIFCLLFFFLFKVLVVFWSFLLINSAIKKGLWFGVLASFLIVLWFFFWRFAPWPLFE